MSEAQSNWECPSCGKGPAEGLELTPSGKQIKAHKDGSEKCDGKAPQTPDPYPVKVVPANSKPNTAECVECGEEQPKLKTPGRVRKHINPQTLVECEQRPNVEEDCPACKRQIGLFRMRFKNHKDLAANAKCPASGKTVAEAKALDKKAPQKAKAPAKKADNTYRDLPPLGKSQFKAKRLGEELKQYADPWRYTIENGPASDQATLVAKRGTGKDVEEMRISWWGGACFGGEGKITHSFRGRTIAVRNANAIRLRGQMTHEAIVAEASKVATRKANGTGPRVKKTPEEMQALMPFDPKEADDKTVLASIKAGRTLRWTRVTDGQEEKDTIRSLPKTPISRTKTGIRNLSFTGDGGSRTVRVENLVAVA